MASTEPLSVVARVSALLRAVGSAGEGAGVSTSQAARVCGLARPTAHRLLTALLSEGFVDRDARSGRWQLGPELYLLGRAAAPRYDLTALGREPVLRLAAATGESAFLSVRRGDETVCLLRQDGSFPLRSFVLYEGSRFPLGVVSAGLVILSFLTDREIDEYLAGVDLVPQWGAAHRESALRDRIAATRERGYAVNPGLIVEGSWGMAAAVFDEAGHPVGALTLTGVESRFRADRRAELGAELLREAHLLTQALAG